MPEGEKALNNIPDRIRKNLERDPFMSTCIFRIFELDHICGFGITRRPEWHHVWQYAGNQIQEPWAIVPICDKIHRHEEAYRGFIQLVSLLRAKVGDFEKYPKFDFEYELNRRMDEYRDRVLAVKRYITFCREE